MLYLIKSIYIWLLPPGIFIVALLLLAIYLLRVKRRAAMLTTILALTLYICSTEYFGGMLIRSLEHQYYPPEEVKVDVVVLLGGGAVSDIENVGVKGHLRSGAAARTLTAARLAKLYDLPILYTGGSIYASGASEAKIVAKIMSDFGIPADRVLLESESLNTTQSVRNIKNMLAERGYKQPLVVTSAYHMPRSMEIFKRNDITAVPYPANYLTEHDNIISGNLFFPSTSGLEMTATFIREYLGLIALNFGYGKI